MINLFRDLKIKYLIAVAGGAFIIAVGMTFLNIREWITFIVVLGWAFLMGYLFTQSANKRASAIADLRNNCRLNEYIAQYSDALSKLKDGTPSASVIRMNLAAGYLDMGNTAAAADMMQGVQVKPGSKFEKPMAAIYHNNYSLLFLKSGDIDNAEVAKNACRGVISEGMKPEEKARIESFCALREAQIDICRGNMEGLDNAQNLFEGYLRSATSPLERSSGAYWLARIWNLRGDREGEIHYLKMAEAEGGESMYAAEAKKILSAYAVDNSLV